MGFLADVTGRPGSGLLHRFLFYAPRIAGVLLLTTAAFVVERGRGGGDAAHAVSAFALATVSVLSAWWVVVGALSIGSAALLAIPIQRWLTGKGGASLRQFVLQLNRQAGHVEALFTWVLLSLVWFVRLPAQVLAASSLVAFGPHLVSYLGWRRLRRARARGTAASPEAEDRVALSWERRAFFHAATLVGLLLFALLAPPQVFQILALLLVIAAGALTRMVLFRKYTRPVGEGAHQLVENGRRIDQAVLLLAAGFAIGIPLLVRTSASGPSDRERRAAEWTSCVAEPGQPEVALFLVADTQLRALDGASSGFQAAFMDSIVPVALRPVELDLLSAATLKHFGALYRGMQTTGEGMGWAHLGDVAEVACASEIEGFERLAGALGLPGLAGITPGNHDLTFLGNLFWDPEWSGACKLGRADREWTLPRLRAMLREGDGRRLAVSGANDGFLATVTRLGKAGGVEVLGLFLDTADYGVFNLGLTGIQGAISSSQERWARERLAEHPGARVVLFLHHPVAELSGAGQGAIGRIAASLGDRLLLIVSAHTHLAFWRGPPKLAAGRPGSLPDEVVVGSTIDAPQEAAVLHVGRRDGGFWASVRTVAAVEREPLQAVDRQPPGEPRRALGTVCATDPRAVTASRCRDVVARLRDRGACEGVFGGDLGEEWRAAVAAVEPCSPCLEIGGGGVAARARPSSCPGWTSPKRAMEVALRAAGDRSAADRCERQQRAWELLRCLRGESSVPALPLDRERIGEEVAALYPDPGSALDEAARERRDALVCLGWAASVLQEHKAEGWTFARSLDLAFEQGATLGELSGVALRPRPSVAGGGGGR